VDRLAEVVSGAQRLMVLTGAGISTDSGIPDFRGPQGLWTKNPSAERLSSFDGYVADGELRARAWAARAEHAAWTAEPNVGHLALVEAERRGRILAVATQNIDGLHQAAGSSLDTLWELHGNIWGVTCLSCKRGTLMADELARVRQGEKDPRCQACGGILKSATISFGQPLDGEVITGAVRAAQRCDVSLAIGSTLSVHPAAGLCDVAVQAGARLVILYADPTPYDELATASGGGAIRGRISELLPHLLGVTSAINAPG
jgi:NAD-dependent deacetylase